MRFRQGQRDNPGTESCRLHAKLKRIVQLTVSMPRNLGIQTCKASAFGQVSAESARVPLEFWVKFGSSTLFIRSPFLLLQTIVELHT